MQALFFKKACYFGKIFTKLERILPNWKEFYRIGKVFTELERFLPNWKNFCRIGKFFTKLETKHTPSTNLFLCGFVLDAIEPSFLLFYTNAKIFVKPQIKH